MAKKILIVEDDPFILDIYSSQFKKEGYLIDVATDGQMALERIKNNGPDLVLLDIELPRMNGWDVLKVLRDDPVTKDLKVVIISNNNQEEAAQNIAKFNVLKYFLKIEHTASDIIAQVKNMLKQ